MKMIVRANSHPMSTMGLGKILRSKHGLAFGGVWIYGSVSYKFKSHSQGNRRTERSKSFAACSFNRMPLVELF